MVIGRHKDGRVYLMALEFLIPAMVRSPDGKWHRQDLTAEELNEFAVIRDQKIIKEFLTEVLQLTLNELNECICPKDCDCANPDGEGVASVSNACPEHNLHPKPVDECPAEEHKGGQKWPIR